MENWEASWNRDVLERIVALLFALAGLADRAASAPYLRRRQVLEILSRGEAEARAFLFGTATGALVTGDAPERAGDAARLAVRLRALALVLCMMLAQPSGVSGVDGPRVARSVHRMSGPAIRRLDTPAPPAADTS